MALLETLLNQRIFTMQGGHNDTTFQALWSKHRDRLESRFADLTPVAKDPGKLRTVRSE